jgi:radical SAM protein with 4Fe4S-binding SPASM domain
MSSFMVSSGFELYSCLWELTLKCNLNCIHCGSVAGSAKQQELTLDECFRICDEIIELGCKDLTFIGGEVFFYHGWEKIANYLSKHKVMVNLISNGLRIGEREVSQIRFANLSNIGISIDGTEAIHNVIRGNKNSFHKIQESIKLLNQAEIPIGAVTSLMGMNYPALEDLYQFLIDSQISLWQIQLVNPMGNMADKRTMILDENLIPDLINFIKEKNKERRILIIAADNIGYFYDNSEVYIRGTMSPLCYYSGCKAGLNTCFIDSVGNVKGCGALYDEKFIEGNLRQERLSEIWNNPGKFSYNRKFNTGMLTGICKECDVASECKGGCRASNYFNKNSLYENAYCAHYKS